MRQKGTLGRGPEADVCPTRWDDVERCDRNGTASKRRCANETEYSGKVRSAKPMDLNDLVKPIVFHVPALGDLQVDVLSDSFPAWFTTWDTPAGEPADLVRSFLRELTRTAGPEAAALDTAKIDALEAEDLDAAAAAFVSVAAGYLRPRYVAEGVGERRKVRKRGNQEAYDVGPRDGERPTAQLLRLLRDWREDRGNRDWLLGEAARRATRDVMRAFGGVGEFQRALDQQLKLQRSPGFALALDAARSPAIGTVLQDFARQQETIAANVTSLKLGLAAYDEQRVKLATLITASRPTVPDLKALGLYPEIGATIARLKVGLVDTTSFDAMRRLEASIGQIGSQMRDRERMILGAADVFRQANRLFDLGIPGAALAAMTALPLVDVAGGLPGTKLSVFPPGYQLTAALGVASPLARGAIADVLHHYGEEPSPDQPTFGGALEAHARIDANSKDRGELVSWLENFATVAMVTVRNEADALRRAGLLVLLGLVLQAISTWHDVYDDGATSIDVAQATNRLDTMTKEIQGLRAEVAGLRKDRSQENLRIRFVHARAPLRRDAHGQAPLMRYVYPDQRLRVIDERGDWVMVEVFDYHGETLERGWIARARVRQQALDD